MLSLHSNEPGPAPQALPASRTTESLVWIDLLHPTRDEEHEVEAWLGLSLPTREDMAEIEASSRLYTENGAAYMTAMVAFFGGAETLQSGPVTFVLMPGRLITIRYIEPRSFDIFIGHCERQPTLKTTAAGTLANLLDIFIDRTADLIERTGEAMEEQSRSIFRRRRDKALEDVVIELGRAQSDMAKIRDSLVTFARLVAFVRGLDETIVGGDKAELQDVHDRLKTLAQDITSLSDHASYVTGNIVFLLDAALGLINLEQNNIIRLLSITSAVFLPLTLIASIYGMNFAHIPFSEGPNAFIAMLGIMAVVAGGLVFLFRRQRWI